MLSRFAFVGLVLGVAACREPTGPAAVAESSYALKTIAGQPLPHVAWVSQNFTSLLVGDTLNFKADGTGEELITYEFEPRGGPIEESGQNEVLAFTYTISGRVIEISFECPGLASCAPPPHYVGVVADGRITIASTMSTEGTRVFERK